MKITTLFYTLFCCSMLLAGLHALAQESSWTVLLYAESDATLNDAVFKNIYDLMRAQSNDRVHIVVQLHCWDKTAWRFVVKDHALCSDGETMLSLQPAQDLIDGARWAFKKFPAEHYMLIFGSHGFGILDPVWSDDANDWITENPEDMTTSCPFKRNIDDIDAFLHFRTGHRGVLFYPPNTAHAYLTNQGMVDAFGAISNEVLCGKKIDIIGMDACRMAMLEVAYQLAPYANFLIGTQDCELKDGWDYYALANFLAQGNKTSREVAAAQVHFYGDYYRDNAPKGFYTQSAIDLGCAAAIIDNLDAIIDCVMKKQDLSSLKEMVRVARKQQPSFCEMPSYVDLVNFYTLLKNGLALRADQSYLDLMVLLDQGIDLVKGAVVANVTGVKSAHAHGISLYFPWAYKESSYAYCAFARDTQWCTMLGLLFSENEQSCDFL